MNPFKEFAIELLILIVITTIALVFKGNEPTPAEQVRKVLEQAHYACIGTMGTARNHCMKEVCLLQGGPETVCNSLTLGYTQ